MPAHTVHLHIEQGATFDRTWTWKTGTPPATPTVVDLTGCVARAQMRATLESDDILLALTTENGRIVLGGTAGTIQIVIDADTTAAIDWTDAVYDLEIVFADGTVVRRMQGSVCVSPGVTRD
ncbi:MAG: hypothetical protein QM692_23755 [Thermomicrobiales bacterium]